jgi:hypothetical protein
MDVFMFLIILAFMFVGLAICASIGFYLFTSVRWQKHDFIRKSVRFGAAFFQFSLFPLVSCIVKRKLYYRDRDRFSDQFWRRFMCVVWPTIRSQPIKPFRKNDEGQNLRRGQVLIPLNENWYTNLKYALIRRWYHGIVMVLFIGKCCAFLSVLPPSVSSK